MGPLPSDRARASRLREGDTSRLGCRSVSGARLRSARRSAAACGGRAEDGTSGSGSKGEKRRERGRGAQVHLRLPRVLHRQGGGEEGSGGGYLQAEAQGYSTPAHYAILPLEPAPRARELTTGWCHLVAGAPAWSASAPCSLAYLRVPAVSIRVVKASPSSPTRVPTRLGVG
eukprot:2163519-Prymnesium_polylepis.2